MHLRQAHEPVSIEQTARDGIHAERRHVKQDLVVETYSKHEDVRGLRLLILRYFQLQIYRHASKRIVFCLDKQNMRMLGKANRWRHTLWQIDELDVRSVN